MSGAYFYRTFASKASLSEISDFPILEFFNRISPKLTFSKQSSGTHCRVPVEGYRVPLWFGMPATIQFSIKAI